MKSIKIATFTLAVTMGVLTAQADVIGSAQALQIAKQFAGQASYAAGRRGISKPQTICEAHVSEGYYAFNLGTNDGFVIVASNDAAASPILGYSLMGHFDYENAPENLRWWLSEYDKQIASMDKATKPMASAINPIGSIVVGPLLKTTWGQDAPFNDYCTELEDNGIITGNSVTGCVATATAQIMKYYEWPEQGTGTHSYQYTINNTNVKFERDFSESVYDWENMRDDYGYMGYTLYYDENDQKWYYDPKRPLNITDEEKTAVARLLKDIGIASNMTYKGGASSASELDAATGLFTYLGYKNTLAPRKRSLYSDKAWDRMLREELDAKRPILYSGSNAAGSGHAFVCDGYDTKGYFHINWGWSGKGDGYFLSTALDPETSGTGGNGEGYSYNQSVVIGIEPQTSTPSSPTHTGYEAYVENLSSSNGLDYQFKIHYDCLDASSVYFYLCAENLMNGSTSNLYATSMSTDYASYWSGSRSKSIRDMNLSDGVYRVYLKHNEVNAFEGSSRCLAIVSDPNLKSDTYYYIVKIANGSSEILDQFVEGNVRYCLIDEQTAMALPDEYCGSVTLPAVVTHEGNDYIVSALAPNFFSDGFDITEVTMGRNFDCSKTALNSNTTLDLSIDDSDQLDWLDNTNNFESVSYTRDFADYGTLVLPFNVDATVLAAQNIKVYSLAEEGGLVFDEVDAVLTGKPYFYVNEDYSTISGAKTLKMDNVSISKGITPTPTKNSDWEMKGTLSTFKQTGNWGDDPVYYGLADDYKICGARKSITIWPYRAYFERLGNSASNSIVLRNGDGTTSIMQMAKEEQEGQIFDLQGRRVDRPKSGIYIINDQKVLVK